MDSTWIPFDWLWRAIIQMDLVGYLIVAVGAVVTTMLILRQYPRYLEGAMARKLERETVAQLLSDALQNACHNGQITDRQWHKYNKKVARWFNLPDMLPREKRFVFSGSGLRNITAPAKHMIEYALKPQIVQRLLKMGVKNPIEAAKNLRSKAPQKREKIKPLPLP